MEAGFKFRVLFSAGKKEPDEGVSSEAVKLVVNMAGRSFILKAEEAFQRRFYGYCCCQVVVG